MAATDGHQSFGVRLRRDVLERLDELAAKEGTSRSKMIGALVQRADSRAPEVLVDGRRFVPARKGRS